MAHFSFSFFFFVVAHHFLFGETGDWSGARSHLQVREGESAAVVVSSQTRAVAEDLSRAWLRKREEGSESHFDPDVGRRF